MKIFKGINLFIEHQGYELHWISLQKPCKQEESPVQYFKAIKEENSLSRIMYPTKVTFIGKGEIITFSDQQKWKEIVGSRDAF